MTDKKRMAINMTSQTITFLVAIFVGFFLAPFVTGKIGKEVYGFVGFANSFVSYASVAAAAIGGVATRYMTVEYVRKNIAAANGYYTSAAAANTALVAALLSAGIPILANLERFMNVPAEHMLDIKLMCIFIFLAFAVQCLFSQVGVATFITNRLELNGIRIVTSSLLRLALILSLFFLLKPRVVYAGIAVFICAVYEIALNFIYKKRLTPELHFNKKLFSMKSIFEMLSVGIWNSVSVLNEIMFTGMDLWIANIFINPVGMSLLALAKMLPAQTASFIGITENTFRPQMTIAYASDDKEKFVASAKQACIICGFLCSVPVVGIIAFGKSFFTLWLPALTAAEISQIQRLSVLTLVPQLITAFVSPLYQINTITCRLRAPALVNLGLGAMNVVSMFVLLKTTSLGLYAIAGTSTALLVFGNLIFEPLYAAHCAGVSPKSFYPTILRGLLLNAAMLVLFLAIRRLFDINGWLSFGIAVITAAISGYALGFLLLFGRERRKSVLEFVKRKLAVGK